MVLISVGPELPGSDRVRTGAPRPWTDGWGAAPAVGCWARPFQESGAPDPQGPAHTWGPRASFLDCVVSLGEVPALLEEGEWMWGSHGDNAPVPLPMGRSSSTCPMPGRRAHGGGYAVRSGLAHLPSQGPQL